MRLRTMIFAGAFLVVSGITPASAQQCGWFWYDRPCEDLGIHGHKFIENLGTDGRDDPDDFHNDCRLCEVWDDNEQEWVGVHPSVCHTDCVKGLEQEEQEAFEELLNAAVLGDLNAALVAGRRVPSRVSLHMHRRALQIVDCDGETVATLPLGKLFYEATQMFDAADQSRTDFADPSREGDGSSGIMLILMGLLIAPVALRARRSLPE